MWLMTSLATLQHPTAKGAERQSIHQREQGVAETNEGFARNEETGNEARAPHARIQHMDAASMDQNITETTTARWPDNTTTDHHDKGSTHYEGEQYDSSEWSCTDDSDEWCGEEAYGSSEHGDDEETWQGESDAF